MSAVPGWIIENDGQWRPTEVFVPVLVGIGPVWDYPRQRGGWFARLLANLPDFDSCEPMDLDFASCSHVHDTEAEAWSCAEGLVRELTAALVSRRAIAGGTDG